MDEDREQVLPRVLLYSQVNTTDRPKACTANHVIEVDAWLVPPMKNSGRCHTLHTSPTARLAAGVSGRAVPPPIRITTR